MSLYAAFGPDGKPRWNTLDPSYVIAIGAAEGLTCEHWADLKKLGWRLKPVEIVAKES